MKQSVFVLLDRYPELGENPRDAFAFVLEHAALAEELGFEALWLTEHHFKSLGAPNPAVLLAAIAARTARLRVGTSVSVLPYRSPTFVAEDYALVDLISNGRLNMGVGSGSQEAEYAELGIPFETRRDAFERNLAELKELWSSDRLNVSPHHTPPLYISTNDAEKAQGIGVKGDSVITLLGPGTSDLDGVGRLVKAHRNGLREGSHEPDAAEVVVAQFACVASSDEEVLRDGVPALGRVLALLAGSDKGAEEMFDTMKQAGTACFGTNARAQETRDQLAAVGVEHVAYITRFGNLSAPSAHDSLRRLQPAPETELVSPETPRA